MLEVVFSPDPFDRAKVFLLVCTCVAALATRHRIHDALRVSVCLLPSPMLSRHKRGLFCRSITYWFSLYSSALRARQTCWTRAPPNPSLMEIARYSTPQYTIAYHRPGYRHQYKHDVIPNDRFFECQVDISDHRASGGLFKCGIISTSCATSNSPMQSPQPIQSSWDMFTKRLKSPLVFPWPDPLTSEMGSAHSLATCPRPAPITSTLPIVPPGVLLTEFGRFHAVVWKGDDVKPSRSRRWMGKLC
ncbi:hypothetical protein SCLCIDRAFT_307814 [Scleroderma citrinum Foug A]|uniref:Uncharacterized protein n=1 Tax=Scleroderma citrinum Foug A TaxID=1036808 RepID=A0A0C2ZRS7_9AGAM|nr:hypothetical protein SCLCIDRAFT_307814 [Scleroderma citrinum Foug A]